MKISACFLLIGLGIVASARLNSQQPVYVPAVESCLSFRNESDGSRAFYNNCSNKIYASVFTSNGLVFDGYYNSGHMDDVPPNEGRVRYFACPASAEPEDAETGERVTFDTSSYKCRKTGT
jgi:hypothetical protein